MEILGSVARKLDVINEPAQKLHVINKYLLNKELTLRSYPYNIKIKVLKPNDTGTQIAAGSLDYKSFLVGQEFSFFTLLAKYIQIDVKVLKIKEDGTIFFQLLSLAIARDNRIEPRVPNNGSMHASNLVTAKTVIEGNMFQIPTLVKVAFDEFKSKLKPPQFEFTKIDIFKSSLPRRFQIVKKTNRALFLADTQNKESYFPTNPEYLSYEKDIDEDVDAEIKEFQEDLIQSEAIIPIIYTPQGGSPFAMGYIWVQNRENPLKESDVGVLKKTAEDIIQRIHESNTMVVESKFPIIDASKSGVQIQVEDENLMKILPKQRSIHLDIYFPLQAPLTVMGDIRWIAKKTDNKLLLGLHLDAKSDNPGERIRYLRNLENLQQTIELEKEQKG